MRIAIPNARLAFPDIWAPRVPDEGGGKAKYGGLFIISPSAPVVAELRNAFAAVAKEKWGTKADVILKAIIGQDKTCLHEGNVTKSQYNGFQDMLYVSARTEQRPTIVDRNRTPLTQADGKPYSGCYVTALVELYAQDNKYGKRINAQLRGLQFSADGDAFAAGTPAAEDEFADLGDQGADTDPLA